MASATPVKRALPEPFFLLPATCVFSIVCHTASPRRQQKKGLEST
nr:MAG TPA: hypothetical protein [Caudoviricetes sp.]DAN83455.1 MAG TPA: hypothetical protein [Caudoviricetes sp.]